MYTAAMHPSSSALLCPQRTPPWNAPVRLDRSAQLSLFEAKRRLLKRLLHLAPREKPEVAALCV
jgi:hypothetical protein